MRVKQIEIPSFREVEEEPPSNTQVFKNKLLSTQDEMKVYEDVSNHSYENRHKLYESMKDTFMKDTFTPHSGVNRFITSKSKDLSGVQPYGKIGLIKSENTDSSALKIYYCYQCIEL